MAANDRNNPINRKASDSDMTVVEFWREYPDDAACLDKLWRERFAPDGHHAHCPVCEKERKFHRINSRASYACDSCGKHLHPMKGTIFEKSTTSLQLWFYAMFLMASTRCGISAKQLERELGVTYKTAWRMFNKIRNELMNDEGDDQLNGKVEVDETSWGGKPRRKMTRAEGQAFREAKTTILGMVEREGRVRLRVIESRRGEPLSSAVRTHVNPDAFMLTDDWVAYKPLRREGYAGAIINHSAGSYVWGDVHTNTIEGFFGNLKTGMRGAYKHVSDRWLQSYLDEYAWRYNARRQPDGYFEQLLRRAVSQSAS
ncbi:MAG: IS1595 family transposase [Actinobacteria bacterium]|nr:IS1595 family transposase [Actinomycetota bacterium]